MIRLRPVRRSNNVWLIAMSLLIAFALIAGGAAVPLPVQLFLLGLFTFSLGASMLEFGKQRKTLVDAIRSKSRQRISPAAKEALDRARNRGGYDPIGMTMMDVGLIAVQSSYEGIAMRRTRSVSKDDDGVRPFVVLHVEPSEADRNARIRFEVQDHNGQTKYVHELKTYLRDGEINIMADHHLPLSGNEDIIGAGDWELRVLLDGSLVGVQHFTLAPSMTERARRLAQHARANNLSYYDEEDEALYEVIDEPAPPRIQDLLKSKVTDTTPPNVSRRSQAATRRKGKES